ncbi:MAG: 2-dehydropantoate 2-reductase [Clostridia bacterium]|nr:2-dehydropantoate 2-reductase [Clostridia bacterium]
MRAAIYGAGAMGTILGAYITKNGGQIDLITRNIAHVRGLQTEGAHVMGQVDFTVPVTAYTPDQMSGKYDIIFLMTKQRDNTAICEGLLPYLAEDGVICTTQNGLPEPSVAAVAGEERTLGCAVSWGATNIGGGIAELTSSPDKMTFSLGSLYGDNPKISAVAHLLSKAGKVTVEKNFIGARWAKLSVNCAFSSLSAMSGLTFGEVAQHPKGRQIALNILNECFAVAKAADIKVAKLQGHNIERIYTCGDHGFKRRIALWLLPAAMKSHRNIKSGMYFDIIVGKRSDIDFVNGVVEEFGKSLEMDTPLNSLCVQFVNEISEGKRKAGVENFNEFIY